LARFISKFRNYGTTVVHGLTPEAAFAIGEKQRKSVIADFQWVGRGASPWEIDAALEVFDIRGVAVGEDPSWRLSFYDTELEQKRRKWSDELRAEIEAALRNHSGLGVDFIEVDQPAHRCRTTTIRTIGRSSGSAPSTMLSLTSRRLLR
jgi:hypothetical protein